MSELRERKKRRYEKRYCGIDGCGKTHYGLGYCHTHYQRYKRNGDPNVAHTAPDLGKWMREHLSSECGNRCIEWPFGKDRHGYGIFRDSGKKIPAHRYVLIQSKGNPPSPNHHALHQPGVCKNPSCVNPNHLRWGTRQENMADRVIDGTANRGEKHGMAKLTAMDVRRIRSGNESPKKLAKNFGVSEGYIRRVKLGDRWSWLK